MAQQIPQPLNEAQIYLLKLFSVNPSKEELDDIKRLIAKYYAGKAGKMYREMTRPKNEIQ